MKSYSNKPGFPFSKPASIERKYVSPVTDRQISTILAVSSIQEYYNLCYLIGKHIKYKTKGNSYRVLASKILASATSDRELYLYIKNLEPSDNTIKQYNENEDCSYVVQHYPNILIQYMKDHPDHVVIDSYLDIGCGTGYKTIKIGEQLGLPNTSVFGVDVKEWSVFGNIERPESINFQYIQDDGTLPFSDGSFSIISAFMVLHHVIPEKLNTMIQEIYRCLKPGGLFIIREHNVEDQIDDMMCDIEHMLYDYDKIPDFNPKKAGSNVNMYYASMISWEKTITEHKFKLMVTDMDWTRKHTIGPTKPFHSIFRKIE